MPAQRIIHVTNGPNRWNSESDAIVEINFQPALLKRSSGLAEWAAKLFDKVRP